MKEVLQKETGISWKNDTYLFEKMEKWSLKPKKLKWKQTRKKKGKWKKLKERSQDTNYNINVYATKKVRIKYFGKPFKEENNNEIESENSNEMKQTELEKKEKV
jgi:hypothetical protein